MKTKTIRSRIIPFTDKGIPTEEEIVNLPVQTITVPIINDVIVWKGLVGKEKVFYLDFSDTIAETEFSGWVFMKDIVKFREYFGLDNDEPLNIWHMLEDKCLSNYR